MFCHDDDETLQYTVFYTSLSAPEERPIQPECLQEHQMTKTGILMHINELCLISILHLFQLTSKTDLIRGGSQSASS